MVFQNSNPEKLHAWLGKLSQNNWTLSSRSVTFSKGIIMANSLLYLIKYNYSFLNFNRPKSSDVILRVFEKQKKTWVITTSIAKDIIDEKSVARFPGEKWQKIKSYGFSKFQKKIGKSIWDNRTPSLSFLKDLCFSQNFFYKTYCQRLCTTLSTCFCLTLEDTLVTTKIAT